MPNNEQEIMPAQLSAGQKPNNAESAEISVAPSHPGWSPSYIVIYILTWISRVVLGATFIFSGTVKAIDPWGTIYKMHDYITAMPGGFLSWTLPLLTPVSFVLFTFEVLLGVALVTGSYRRLAPIGTLLLMFVMLPLTLWIALKNPVADCGCFGDAWILSNWQTFWKNIVLTAMSIWLVIFNKRARCLILPTLQWLMFAGTVVFTVTVGFIGYSIQPMIDFRPYPVGETLIDAEDNLASTAEEVAQMSAVWTNGTETITIPADSIPEGDTWEFVDRVSSSGASSEDERVTVKGLAVFDGAEDITEELVAPEGEQVLVFMTDLPNISSGNFYKLNSLYAYCKAHDVQMATIAAATPLQIDDFVDHSLAEYPIYTAEDTAIKEVVRGNPAIVYLKDGKIVWKSSLSAVPAYDFMESTPDKQEALAMYAPFTDKNVFKTICLIFISFIALVIFLSHVPMVIRFTARKFTKSRWVKDGAVVKTIAILMMTSLLVSCKDEPDKPKEEISNERTILIYMVATNSLHSESYSDIKEILEGYASLEENNTNILIYQTVPNETAPTLSRVVKDKNGNIFLNEIKTYTSGISSVSKSRISEVIRDIKRFGPAENYSLFLWSHATGWLPIGNPANLSVSQSPPLLHAYGDDYGKSINITDLAEAIPKGTFDLIWMDCCLMGGIETVYQLRNHCDYMVVYPTEILAEGAPYNKIIPYLAGRHPDLLKAAEATYRFYADKSGSSRSCTISVIDTKYLPEVAAYARQIVEYGNLNIPLGNLQIYGKLKGVTFYDFLQTYDEIAGADIESIDALRAATDRTVIGKWATPYFLNIPIDINHFSGLSCTPLNADASSGFRDYYKTLDWYIDVYR